MMVTVSATVKCFLFSKNETNFLIKACDESISWATDK